MDQIYPPLESKPASEIYDIAEMLPVDSQIRVRVVGEDLEGRSIDKTVMLPLRAAGSGVERILEAGLELIIDDGKTIVDNIVFGSAAEKQRIDFDFEIVSIEVETDRPVNSGSTCRRCSCSASSSCCNAAAVKQPPTPRHRGSHV